MPSRFALLRGGLALVRPVNVLIGLFGVVVGALLSGVADVWPYLPDLALAMAAVGGICAGANALNDLADIDVDRLNRPDRPLPSGRVSPRQAAGIGLGLTFAGIGAAALLSPLHLRLALGAVVVLGLYNVRLKRWPLVGNLVVAGVVALALPFGAWAVGNAGLSGIGAAFAGLTTLARELVKDIQDREGDTAENARTLPIVLGDRIVSAFALGLILLTVALTPVPYVVMNARPPYLAFVLLADIGLIASAWSLFAPHPDPGAGSRRLKAAMLAGLIALVFA